MQILPLCYLDLVAASRCYRLVPKMVLTLQLALVVFFLRALTHLLMCILQLALCGGIYIYFAPMCKLRCCCIPLDGCWCLVPLTFSNLCWWCFSFQQLAQTLYLHLWWLPSASYAGGLFPSTTCACSNLHCVVVVVVVVYNIM